MKKFLNILEWIFRIGIAVIFIQSLYFKFTSDPQSVELFSKLGVEPWGRYGTGVIELISSVLLFIPKRVWIGAGLALGTMMGAIFSHLTVLGIHYPDGVLFWLAVAVVIMSAFVLWKRKLA